jgi:molybdopterin synthase sulfur carrier subunit
MRVEVKYYAMLRDTSGKKMEEFSLPDGAMMKDLLNRLVEMYGDGFGRHIYDKQGKHRRFLTYLVNGINIHSRESFDTPLGEGDSVAIMPPVGGG